MRKLKDLVLGVLSLAAGIAGLVTTVLVVTYAITVPIEYLDCKSYAANTGNEVTFSPVSGCYVFTEDFQFVQKDSIVSIAQPARRSEEQQ